MSLEDALNEMELVGHDFYLFHDVETGKPSVLYRRRGWSYGVIHLDVAEPAEVGRVIGWLCGDDARMVSGNIIRMR